MKEYFKTTQGLQKFFRLKPHEVGNWLGQREWVVRSSISARVPCDKDLANTLAPLLRDLKGFSTVRHYVESLVQEVCWLAYALSDTPENYDSLTILECISWSGLATLSFDLVPMTYKLTPEIIEGSGLDWEKEIVGILAFGFKRLFYPLD